MKSIVSILTRYMLSLCFSSIIIFGGITVYFMITDYKKELLEVETKLMGGVKDSLTLEVSRIQNFIEFSRNNAQSQALKNIKAFVLEAHTLASKFYDRYKDSMPEQELQMLIKETLRSMVHEYDDSYIFIVGMDGIEQLNTDRPAMELTDVSNVRTPDGRYVIQEMIALVNSQDEGFINYLWTKPGSKGKSFEKKSYIKNFKPYEWLIGTGAYYDTIRVETQKTVLDRLSKINQRKDSYVFAGSYSGDILLNSVTGKKKSGFKDPEEIKNNKNLITTAKSGGGFLSYSTPSIDPGHKGYKKLSYCTSIPEWKWYIGAGMNINSLEKKLDESRFNLLELLIIKISFVCGLLLLYSIAILYFSGRFKRMLGDNFSSFESFFRKGMDSPVKIDRSQIAFTEFDQMAGLANSMIDSRESAKNDLLKSEITYREIFNSTKDAIAVMDISKRIFIDINQAFLDFFGMNRTEAVGMSPEMISFNTPPYDNKYAAELFKKAQMGESVHFEWMVKKKTESLSGQTT